MERIEQDFLVEIDKEAGREAPQIRSLRHRPPMQEVLELTSRTFGPKNRHARNAAIFVIHRNTDYRLREIGEFFKLSTSAITEACRRFRKQVTSNETLARHVQGVESQLFKGR